MTTTITSPPAPINARYVQLAADLLDTHRDLPDPLAVDSIRHYPPEIGGMCTIQLELATPRDLEMWASELGADVWRLDDHSSVYTNLIIDGTSVTLKLRASAGRT